MTINIDIDTIILKYGSHTNPEDGMCFNEAVAMLAGEPFSDNSSCICPTIRVCTLRFNDRCGSDDTRRTRVLRPLLGVVVGTRGSTELTRRRAWLGVDWAWREALPRILRLTPFGVEWRPRLEALPEIVDKPSLDAAIRVVSSMHDAARSWSTRTVGVVAAEVIGASVGAVAAVDAAAALTALAMETLVLAATLATETLVLTETRVLTEAAADPKLIAVAKAALDNGGDYWAAGQAVREHILTTGGLGAQSKFTALRDELDGEFQALIRRMAAMPEQEQP